MGGFWAIFLCLKNCFFGGCGALICSRGCDWNGQKKTAQDYPECPKTAQARRLVVVAHTFGRSLGSPKTAQTCCIVCNAWAVWAPTWAVFELRQLVGLVRAARAARPCLYVTYKPPIGRPAPAAAAPGRNRPAAAAPAGARMRLVGGRAHAPGREYARRVYGHGLASMYEILEANILRRIRVIPYCVKIMPSPAGGGEGPPELWP